LAASGSALAVLPGCESIAGAPAGRDKKPNVLLIMTDDQGWGDIHSHGNELIDTPVLGRLASDGARFERFFASPVRAHLEKNR
jgi:hypothetical protein